MSSYYGLDSYHYNPANAFDLDQEKMYWGRTTTPVISTPSSVSMYGTCVRGPILSGGDVKASKV